MTHRADLDVSPRVSPRIGELFLDGSRPVIAASFDAPVTGTVLAQAQADGLDLAELRIDLFPDVSIDAVVNTVARFSGLPVLATIRHPREGGSWSRSEPERLALFSAVLAHVDAVDVELASEDVRDAVVEKAHALGKTAVLSFHDFAATPSLETLRRVVGDARGAGADIVKIAAMARGDADVRTLAHLLLEVGQTPLVAIAMGTHGVKSRVFFPALGSRFTFAALGRSTAPGQMPLQRLVEEIRTFYPSFDESRARSR